MPDKLDSLFDQVTGHGKQITANGLYSLRREVLAQAKQGKWSELPAHASSVLERAVALYNETSGSAIPLQFVNAMDEYPDLGISELTLRFEQGELGFSETGHPEPALTFHRFVKRQGLGDAFRSPSAPRRLPYIASDDHNANGKSVVDILNELDLGQDGAFGSVKELQKFLNNHKAAGAARLSEDDRLGPMSVNAIRERLIARVNAAVARMQFVSLINTAQVLFQDMKGTAMELGRRTVAGESAPDLYVNPLYDGELRGILEARIKAVSA
jgi:hypothetical protein